jgi:hypothetical protein
MAVEENNDVKMFYAWITAVTSLYEPKLIAALLERGYAVSSAAADGRLSVKKDSAPCVLIAIKLAITVSKVTPHVVYTDITDCLKLQKAMYYSIVVAEAVPCAWNGSNIILEETIDKVVNKEDLN